MDFTAGLESDRGLCEWEGRHIWAATRQGDFSAYFELWASVHSDLAHLIPPARYPSQAGHRAAFVDVGLGSSLAFSWALKLDWDTQFSTAIVTSIAYWADQASGDDAPPGQLSEIFDAMPSLVQACATGRLDRLSPMKALAIEYLHTVTIKPCHGPVPSVRDVWLSRLADVGAREICVLTTGCPTAFSEQRSDDYTRCLVAWGILHDFFDLPRDLANGNRVNGVLWALFAGFSGRAILEWLRDTVAIACRRGSCAARLLLCTAFVHVTNPRWAGNHFAVENFSELPDVPRAPITSTGKLPLFSNEDDEVFSDPGSTSVCVCASAEKSHALGIAAANAMDGTVAGFANMSERLDAHNIGMSALIGGDWDTLIDLSRTAWSSLLSDFSVTAAWVDGC